MGKRSYKIASVSKPKFKKYFKINASTGKVTVKKKLKKGTYKVKIVVSASGNERYYPRSQTVTATIKVN